MTVKILGISCLFFAFAGVAYSSSVRNYWSECSKYLSSFGPPMNCLMYMNRFHDGGHFYHAVRRAGLEPYHCCFLWMKFAMDDSDEITEQSQIQYQEVSTKMPSINADLRNEIVYKTVGISFDRVTKSDVAHTGRETDKTNTKAEGVSIKGEKTTTKEEGISVKQEKLTPIAESKLSGENKPVIEAIKQTRIEGLTTQNEIILGNEIATGTTEQISKIPRKPTSETRELRNKTGTVSSGRENTSEAEEINVGTEWASKKSEESTEVTRKLPIVLVQTTEETKPEAIISEELAKNPRGSTTDLVKTTEGENTEPTTSNDLRKEKYELSTENNETSDGRNTESTEAPESIKEIKEQTIESEKTTRVSLESRRSESLTKETELFGNREKATTGTKMETTNSEDLAKEDINLTVQIHETTSNVTDESVTLEDPKSEVQEITTERGEKIALTEVGTTGFEEPAKDPKITTKVREVSTIRTKLTVETHDEDISLISNLKELSKHEISATVSIRNPSAIEISGVKTLKTAVSAIFLVIALVATAILTIYMIKVKRKTIAYDQLKLLP